MKHLATAILAVWCVALPAAAQAPENSLRPMVRPDASEPASATEAAVLAAAVMAAVQPVAPVPKLDPAPGAGEGTRPRPRGGAFAAAEAPSDSLLEVTRQVTRIHYGAQSRPHSRPPHPLADATVTLAAIAVPFRPGAPEPKARPAGFKDLFRRREGGSSQSYSAKGAVCGVNAIKGAAQESFGKPNSGCGISNPVRVIEVSGVRLSTPATIDCTTAKALNSWVENSLKPAFKRRGGGVSQITIAASYTCRNRNNAAGGKLSEHAKGHAVDISGFVLKDGGRVTVLDGWRSRSDGKALKKVHRAACGPFGTVLGPNADRNHQDHFHFDTARYRSGTYCR